MIASNYKQQYLKTKVETASPGDLTLLLYEELHRKLNMAKMYFEKEEMNEMMNYIHGSREILTELIATLNFEYDIARQLYSLYHYYLRKLNEFAISKRVSDLNEILEFAKEYSDTWRQALQLVKSNKVNG